MLRHETGRHLQAFEIWHEAHRSFHKTSAKYHVTERSLRIWAESFSWHARADARDREAARIADADAVKRRAEMLRRHRQAAELLTRRGMEHHAQRPIEKASDATAAIKAGIEIERTAEGLPTWVAGILNAQSDDELAAMERALLGDGAEAGAPDDPPPPAGAGEG